MNRPIRFIVPNRYGVSVNDTVQWDHGVSELLVHRGIAVWADENVKPVQAAVSQPVAEQPVKTETPEAPDEPEPDESPLPIKPKLPEIRKRSMRTDQHEE